MVEALRDAVPAAACCAWSRPARPAALNAAVESADGRDLPLRRRRRGRLAGAGRRPPRRLPPKSADARRRHPSTGAVERIRLVRARVRESVERAFRGPRAPTATWTDCYGANFSCPRERLIEVGGVAIDLPAARTSTWRYRLCQAGCRPPTSPNALAVHDDQKRARRMLADAWRQGRRLHVELAARFPELTSDVLDWPRGAGAA